MSFARLMPVAACVACTWWMTGCGSYQRVYPGEDPARVWTALKAAAETPDYNPADYTKRWNVDVNQVFVVDDEHRIEVYRELSRILQRPRTQPIHEDREWTYTVTMKPNPDEGSVKASLRFRDAAIPMKAREEADRFFHDVAVILGIPDPQDAMFDEADPPKPEYPAMDEIGQPVTHRTPANEPEPEADAPALSDETTPPSDAP